MCQYTNFLISVVYVVCVILNYTQTIRAYFGISDLRELALDIFNSKSKKSQ